MSAAAHEPFSYLTLLSKIDAIKFLESVNCFSLILQVILNLTFAQAAKGVVKEAIINVVDTCPVCKGSRCTPGTKPGPCTWCNGSGMETISNGNMMMISAL